MRELHFNFACLYGGPRAYPSGFPLRPTPVPWATHLAPVQVRPELILASQVGRGPYLPDADVNPLENIQRKLEHALSKPANLEQSDRQWRVPPVQEVPPGYKYPQQLVPSLARVTGSQQLPAMHSTSVSEMCWQNRQTARTLPVGFPERGTQQEKITFCLTAMKKSLERSTALQIDILGQEVKKATTQPSEVSSDGVGSQSPDRVQLSQDGDATPELLLADAPVMVRDRESSQSDQSQMGNQGTRGTVKSSRQDGRAAEKKHAKRSQKTTDLRKAGKGRISKTKGFSKQQVVNQTTGRLNQNLQCSMCTKKFSKLCNVQDHVRTHYGSKPFACANCGQRFSQRGNRDRHQKKDVCVNRTKSLINNH